MANRCSDTIKQVRDELTKLNQLDLDNIISWFGRQIITDEIKQKVEPLLASINSAVEAVIGHLGKMIDYKNFNDQDDSSFYQIYNNYNLISGTIASAKENIPQHFQGNVLIQYQEIFDGHIPNLLCLIIEELPKNGINEERRKKFEAVNEHLGEKLRNKPNPKSSFWGF